MNRRMQLDYQADRIEATLASHKVRTRVAGGTVTPRFVRFDLLPEPGTRIRRINELAEEMALSLNASRCRVFRRGGRVQVEIPRGDPRCVRLSSVVTRLGQVPSLSALLGLDEEAIPVLLRLPSPDVAHVLIAGSTGSGKTALARTMALSLALLNPPRRVQLVLVDPKRRGFVPLEGLPHLLAPLIDDEGRAAVVLGRLVEEMVRRDREGSDTPHIVVFIDELADLMMSGGRTVEDPLTRLAQRGRQAGIHLVACTQRPTASVIGGLIKSNFPVRVVGSVASAEDAKVASGLPRTGAERLLGKGDFIVVARGEQVRVQAAYAGDGEIRSAVARLRDGRPPEARGLGQRVAQATRRLVGVLPASIGVSR
jgi:S-DNA-T family DNA segregation ATPase FtsK/SpoIIIE